MNKLLLITTIIPYLPILKGFFQHDEWLAFSKYFSLDSKRFFNFADIFTLKVGHYTPVMEIINRLFFVLFGLNYQFYAYSSIIGQMIILFLIFFLGTKLFNNKNLGLLMAILFGVNPSGFQVISWISASTSTHLAVIFSLLSVLLFDKFCSKNSKVVFFYSISLYFISLLTKEISIFLPLIMIIYYYLFFFNKKKKNILTPLLAVVIIYLLFRFFMLMATHSKAGSNVLVTETQSLTQIYYNIITFPAKIFVQTILPPTLLVKISYFFGNLVPQGIAGLKGTTSHSSFIEGSLTELITAIIFCLISLLIVVVFKKSSIKNKRIILFGYLFVIINSFIYAFSPQRFGIISLMDSRNLYFPSIGTAIIFTSIYTEIRKKHKVRMLIFLFFYIAFNIYWLQHDLSPIIKNGINRKNILSQIKEENPRLSSKVIFYFESDKSYYGMADDIKTLPFQTGLGQTLLVFLNSSENFPKEFFKNDFLKNIWDQGYLEYEDRGFGYFYEYNNFIETVNKWGISKDSIISYSYQSSEDILINTSEEVKKQIESEK